MWQSMVIFGLLVREIWIESITDKHACMPPPWDWGIVGVTQGTGCVTHDRAASFISRVYLVKHWASRDVKLRRQLVRSWRIEARRVLGKATYRTQTQAREIIQCPEDLEWSWSNYRTQLYRLLGLLLIKHKSYPTLKQAKYNSKDLEDNKIVLRTNCFFYIWCQGKGYTFTSVVQHVSRRFSCGVKIIKCWSRI